MTDVTDDLALLRAFEPNLRLTLGEYFVPVDVGQYVQRCTLWRHEPDGAETELAGPGTLDLSHLAGLGARYDGHPLSLSGLATREARRDRVKAWLGTGRPKFRAARRLAQVGLLGRLVDTLSRVSLLVRGAVPGGSAVTALAIQRDHLEPFGPTYYGRVLRDEPWVVLQYWYFYSFNNWRSGFSGVNEHEADWEQVTVYLDATPTDEGLPEPRWVVYSAHDETGDDLRRRWDDPDLELVGGRHPVLYAGAGSHSGAYLPGDYLITVEPPRLGGVVPAVRRLAKVVTPWARAAQGQGLGIPYVDYARGDGHSIGPSGDREWLAVPIDDSTPWVRDFKGLWGHDTRDRLGGERGPAGPRYERDGSVRQSWGDPVGWAGLAKVSPNPVDEERAVRRRVAELDAEIERLAEVVDDGRSGLRRGAAGLPASEARRELAASEEEVSANRMLQVHLDDERRELQRVLADGLSPGGPHDHLRHRRSPIAAGERTRQRLLGIWSVLSTPLMLRHEANAVGTMAALNTDDYVTCTYRGHHHSIARGMNIERCIAEVLGRADGFAKGKGGSMHFYNPELHIMGSNGIVGAQVPHAAGMALASKIRKDEKVAITFFGDGANYQGLMHETFNMAEKWSLPVIFYCENNRYSEMTPISRTSAVEKLYEFVRAYGMNSMQIDGNDVAALVCPP